MAKRTSALSASSAHAGRAAAPAYRSPPATRRRRPSSSSASTTMAPSAWRKRAAYLRHLVDDAVELDRLGEDVAQLLEREELADAAVELSGELVGPRLGLARPPAGARDGDPESRGDGDQRDGGKPPRPAVRRPDDDAEQRGAPGREADLPLLAPRRRAQRSAPRRLRPPATTSRGRPPNSTARRASRGGAPAEIADGER